MDFTQPHFPPGPSVYLALPGAGDELKDKLDRAINEMKGNGTLNALITKWFGHEVDGF